MNTPPSSSKRLRRLTVAALLALGIGLVATKLLRPSDLRPESVKAGISDDATREARRILAALVTRYGGLDRHRQHRVTQVEYTDEWPSDIIRRVGSPWQRGERLRFTFANGTDNSRLDFLDGPRQGQSWGIQQWQTYTVRGGQRTFSASKDIKFWLPTIEYFLELPFRIGEAQIAAHAGTRVLANQTYDLLYLTWGRAAPQRDVDQYLLWVRRSDGILEFVEYTVRDIAPFMVGCIHYEDLRELDGILLPFRMTLADCPGKPGMLHRQMVEAARILPDLPVRELVPEPERRANKND